jgi:uncharacterized protein YjbI with pentapeptide repeats
VRGWEGVVESTGRGVFIGAIGGTVAGLLSGAVILAATQPLEHRLNDRQERLENLRYLRDVSTRESGPMPFRNIDLEGMNLSGLRFPCRDKVVVEACSLKADFRGAHLSSTNMSLMELQGADFTGADLRKANLSDSDLSGALLINAKLDGANLHGACGPPLNGWPAGVTPPPEKEAVGEVCNRGL